MDDTKINYDDKEQVAHYESKEPLEDQVFETKYANLSRKQILLSKVFWRCLLICMVANWGALNDGFQQNMPGNVLPMAPFVQTMHDITVDGAPALSSKVISFWQGFGETAKMIGQVLGGWLADRFGRKYTLIGAVVILLAGAAVEISSNEWKQFLGGVIVVKLGVGIAQTTLITYVSEIAPFQIRGTMIGAYQLFLGFGQLLSAVATKIIVETNPDVWRPLMATEFIFSGLFIIMLPFIPESHVHHARKGNVEAAKRSLQKLYGTAPNYDVDYEYEVIKRGIEAEEAFSANLGHSSYLEIFQGINLKRTLAGMVGILCQPFTGGPIIWGYSTYFFQLVGLQDPFLITVIIYITLIVTVSISLGTVEYLGRRPVLLWGNTAMLLFNIALGTTGFFDTSGSRNAALGFIILWVAAYGLSAAGVGYIASGETSTPRLRAKTTAFNMGVYGAGYVVFQWSVPYIINPDAGNLGIKATYIFAGLLVPTIAGIWYLYPETTGRTYNELDELYERRIPAWRFKETTTSSEAAGVKNQSLSTHKPQNANAPAA